ncbi:TRAP transporter small permease subunit [Rhodobacteraceae bacterium NNCM2]|nr:TRAP transporter small permease subunit [Coraliihabitans acroporae]
MSNAAAAAGIPPAPAPIVRAFGWSMLFLMGAFLFNVVVTFWVGWPGIGPVMGWDTSDAGALSFLQLAIYGIALAGACAFAWMTPDRTLRGDSERIAKFNQFLIRAAFWVVFLVGLADAAVSFLRVEGLLPDLVGEEMTTELGKSVYRGLWLHVPVMLLGILIALFTRSLGFIWLTLLVVVAELLIVITRFVFSYEQAFMGDLVRFWYAALFLFASAYTLYQDGHVRVDVLYTGMSPRTKGRVNALGAILLGMVLCWTILLLGMWSKSAIIISPILVFETTQSGFGMYVKYFMAGFLAVFAISMMVQFVSSLFEATADARGEEGARETAGSAH